MKERENIDWDQVYKLRPYEFSENPNLYAEPALIYALSKTRKSTQKVMLPSPVGGALARFKVGNSQHDVGSYKNPTRLSTACDVFMQGIPFENFVNILSLKVFNAIGIYLDTYGPDGKPWVMFHLDIRPPKLNSDSPLIWISYKIWSGKTVKSEYRYPQNQSECWKLLNNKKFFAKK